MIPKSAKPKVLIVDDEKSNLKVLSDILKDEANILIAKNGAQALAKAKEILPTLILLDVMMPDMNGFDVITELKKDNKTLGIPVIFITGLSDVVNEEKGFTLGACDYIQKPFHHSIVKARVKLHLQLARQCQMLEELANIDPLSSLANRRKFARVMEQEWSAGRRYKTSIAILMLDIDNFKLYNDNYGHPMGDEVIRKVSQVLSGQFNRPRDFVARYGGEEFVVLLPNTPGEQVKAKMQRCCDAVRSLEIMHEYSEAGVVTISIGGATCYPSAEITPQQAVEAADAHLYLAKGNGKNCIEWQQLMSRNSTQEPSEKE